MLRGWLGIRIGGTWAAKRCGLAVPRQNGKNGCIEIYELFVMIGLGARVLHTAHEMKTARKSFKRLLYYFDNPEKFPELYELVAEIRETNGQEAIFLHNGGSVEFAARSSSSGLGFTVDIIVCDEAQELSDDQLEALQSTNASGPLRNPQVIMTGTPPKKRSKGAPFRRLRTAGHKKLDNRLCWKEWSVEIPGDDPTDPLVLEQLADDRDNWYATNPSLGIRLTEEDVEFLERNQLSTEGFLRERLGVWDDHLNSDNDDDDQPIDLDAWNAGRITNPKRAAKLAPQGVQAFGLEIDRDRAWASFGTAAQCTAKGYEDKVWLELYERRRGVRWTTDYAVELNETIGPITVAIDGGGPAKTEIEPLQDAGIDVLVLDLADVVESVADVVDEINDGLVLHGPQDELDDGVEGARKRSLGGDGNFTLARRASTVDVTPVLAVIFARRALTVLNYDLEDSIH